MGNFMPQHKSLRKYCQVFGMVEYNEDRIGYVAFKHADDTVNNLGKRAQDFFREQNNRYRDSFCIGKSQKVPEKFKLQKL